MISQKIFLSVYIRMLDLTISELRSIAKGRSMDGYQNLFTKTTFIKT